MGLVGVGVGANQLVPALTRGPHARLVAAADLRSDALERLRRNADCATYPSVETLCANPAVEAVWVATPNPLHAAHAITAAESGKHVIVSKPLAITLDEAQAMTAAAERNGVLLLAGHSQSMAPTIRRMAEIVRSGTLGALGMVQTWHATDWIDRPRHRDEFDVTLGGGPVFRQASHQVDIVRTIVGRPVRSVRAQTVQLHTERGAPGAYTALLTFDDGTPASITYSGDGHFPMAELLPIATRETPGASSLGLFGLTLVSCASGDMREAADGVYIYRKGQRLLEPVPDAPRGAAELAELYAAVRLGQPLVHDGHWGAATLEVCLAINRSADTQAEITLMGQTVGRR